MLPRDQLRPGWLVSGHTQLDQLHRGFLLGDLLWDCAPTGSQPSQSRASRGMAKVYLARPLPQAGNRQGRRKCQPGGWRDPAPAKAGAATLLSGWEAEVRSAKEPCAGRPCELYAQPPIAVQSVTSSGSLWNAEFVQLSFGSGTRVQLAGLCLIRWGDDYTAGDPVACIAGGVGLHVVRLFMHHDRRAAVGEDVVRRSLSH